MKRYTLIALFTSLFMIMPQSAISQEWQFYKFLDGHKKSVSCLDFFGERTESEDRSYLVSGSQDGTGVIWDLKTGTPLHTLIVSGEQIWSLAASPDGQSVAFGTGDSKIVLFNPWTGDKQATLTGHEGRIWNIAWDPSGRQLASCDDKGAVMMWNIEKGSIVHSMKSDPNDLVLGTVAISPDGKIVAFTSRRDRIYLHDAKSGARIDIIPDLNEEPQTSAFSPDGKMFATAGADKLITIRSTGNWQIIQELGGHTASVKAVRWSGDSERLFSGGDDKQIIEWSVKSGEVLQKFMISKQYVNDIALCRLEHEWLIAAARPAGIELFEPSLYRRLGGEKNIAALADHFIEGLLANEILNANPAIKEANARVSKEQLKKQITSWLCWSSGGPQSYTGRSMKESHQALNITEKDWQAMLGDFNNSLKKFRVPEKEQDELRAIVGKTRKEIITVPK